MSSEDHARCMPYTGRPTRITDRASQAGFCIVQHEIPQKIFVLILNPLLLEPNIGGRRTPPPNVSLGPLVGVGYTHSNVDATFPHKG